MSEHVPLELAMISRFSKGKLLCLHCGRNSETSERNLCSHVSTGGKTLNMHRVQWRRFKGRHYVATNVTCTLKNHGPGWRPAIFDDERVWVHTPDESLEGDWRFLTYEAGFPVVEVSYSQWTCGKCGSLNTGVEYCAKCSA